MASRGMLDVEVRYLDERGDEVTGPLAGVDVEAMAAGRPVRPWCSHMSPGDEFGPQGRSKVA